MTQSRQHNLSDWLALHELNSTTCHAILNAINQEAVEKPRASKKLNLRYHALDSEAAWLKTMEAMREFLPHKRSFINNTFEHTAKIIVDQPQGSRKAVTLDNGPTAYPTIFISYRGNPSDTLIMAHEFAHALQIRASRGKFVPPILREVCAFLGEAAMLSYNRHHDAALFGALLDVWHRDNHTYLATRKKALRDALFLPNTPYSYSWNYPIARYFAIVIQARCSREWIWSLFQGDKSVPEVLNDLAIGLD